ncbi:hypothetical protein O181_011148 [Austropuccinia psidii MF-1]|uniref:Uncharacterized protein n=1 Tax=Austropuccinia psidii MF-1 TaxID=1389203 RepID=A0A9Q3BUQ5_9BASI|nr:hypothetical protein [Austropuccinia psidii MF-1]
MKPQPQGHVMNNPYHQDDIKPVAILINKKGSPSKYQNGDNMSYSEKEALKHLPEASSYPKFSGAGEYDHMELIDYIYGLFIDVPSIPNYWITDRLNTALKGHASIGYTERKKSMAEESGHGGKVKSSKSTAMVPGYAKIPYDIANTLHDVRKRANIGKQTPYKSSGFKGKQTFRVDFKYKPREKVAKVAKKKYSSHKCVSIDRYANNCPKSKKKVYAIEKVAEGESPTEDSESHSMGDAIREQSDDDQDPREEFLVEYQEETPLEI